MRTLLTITLLTITSSVFGQNTCGFRGRVTDQEGSPFGGLTIEITGKDGKVNVVLTDQDGKYELKDIRTGTYTFRLQQPGYKESVFDVLIEEDEIKTVDILHPRDCYVSKKECPNGHTDHLIPIVYGLPGTKLMKSSAKGRVKLGGCSVSGCDPEWHCKIHNVDF